MHAQIQSKHKTTGKNMKYYSHLREYIKVVGSGVSACKKMDDLMPINVTFTNSGKTAPPEIIKKMLLFTFAASRINSKVCLFSLGYNMKSPIL